MIKTQVQIPDDLFRRAKRVAAAKEWSFAETVRRGLEQIVARSYVALADEAGASWKLPAPVNTGLKGDPFADPNWREEANLSAGAARLMARKLREDAARYEADL